MEMMSRTGWAFAALLALQPPIVLAQNAPNPASSAPPAQNGNVYNGTAHEPNPAATQQQEQSAGVGLSTQQQQQQTNTVEQLDKQLQQTAKTPLPERAGCSADGKTCPP